MSYRLDAPFGSNIDRDQPIHFQFEGKQYTGYQGDTLASALIANGQHLISRSFKYHRARGLLTAAGQDANSLVQLPTEANVLADKLAITPGLNATAQHYKGSLEKDRAAVVEKFSRFLPVGFYYKAFFRPKGVWEKLWAPIVRKSAGLGVINKLASSPYYDKQYRFYDVVVVGAGPAGMEAALLAGNNGASVLLIDENSRIGGSLNYARFFSDRHQTTVIRDELADTVNGEPNIEVMTDSICNGWYADNWLAVITGNRLYKVRAKLVVMAPGSIEQPAVFHNNDLPGIMQGSAAQRLIQLYGAKPGDTAVVLAANDDAYGVALDLDEAGVRIAAIVDLRSQTTDFISHQELASEAQSRGFNIIHQHAIYAAVENAGRNHVTAVEIRPIIGKGECGKTGTLIDCDLVCMSTGYTPTYQLLCQSGASLNYDDDRAMFSINNLGDHLLIAGSVNSRSDLAAVRAEGRHAGWQALRQLNLAAGAEPQIPTFSSSEQVNHSWPIFPHPKGKEFVDYDEDLTISDIRNAVKDGYRDVQLTKRYSTVGMGPSQGRHSALTVARLVAEATHRSVAETGVTTARPPFGPEKLGVLAGRSFYPERHSNMHHRHLEMGAQMLLAGAWLRPAYFGPIGARDQCMADESVNVRNNVGIVDVSTLGGIEVRGPDAAVLMERLYTWNFAKQPTGRARYALLCNEAGVVIDDGVACRLSKQHYYVTATTGGVDRVYQSMLKWNAQWRLDVDVANVTAAWCGINIAGPKSRDVITRVCRDVDFSADAFPYMGIREGTVAGIPARLIRVGFVGELGYEIHVPQHYGEALLDAMMEAGRPEGIQPFGIEAQRLLRLEKGHIIIGQDTDAMTTPDEVNMGWALGKNKPFFIGQRTLQELSQQVSIRRLVGFVVDDLKAPIPREAHLVMTGEHMSGRVTSCYFSPTLGKPIGLAYVTPEEAEPDTAITIKSTGGVLVTATIVTLPFYDPDNARQALKS